jgi:hypothetical protein
MAMNQSKSLSSYGLSIDTVTGFELVLPNGTVVDVTASSAPDLFFGLKVRRPYSPLQFANEHIKIRYIGGI